MENISLSKLLTSPLTKVTWCQVQPLKLWQNKNCLHLSNKSYGTICLKSPTLKNISSIQKKLPNGVEKVYANSFSTSTNNKFWNKLVTHDQNPVEIQGERAEVEPLLVEGVGWAGQPIVRRIHPILPEMNGDLSDVLNAVVRPPGNSEAHKETLLSSQINSIVGSSNNLQVQPVKLTNNVTSPTNAHTMQKNSIVSKNQAKVHIEGNIKTKKSSHTIPIVNEDTKNNVYKIVSSPKTDDICLKPKIKNGINIKNDGKVVAKVGIISKKKNKLSTKFKKDHLKPGLVLSKQKKKIKKNKTKVCMKKSKTSLALMKKTKLKKNKNKKLNMFGVNKKSSFQSNNLLNQRINTQAITKDFMLLENRQIQTYSHANQGKMSIKVNVKEKTSMAMIGMVKAKNQKKGIKMEPGEKYPDDCKCPETLEVKNRSQTQICGEAAGLKDKKKVLKPRKGKMCPVEHIVPFRRRTFVCNSAKFEKAKRKRQLPKCVKPEKKVAPRVIVCPPILEDEMEAAKQKCVKQVEEVKIRSRTKVCKPMIRYEVEKVSTIVQKAECIEKKVNRTISRHTTVCPPSGKNGDIKKSKH